MNINTKAKIGQKIYYMKDNLIHSSEVDRIEIEVDKGGEWFEPVISIYYKTVHYGRLSERFIFTTKEELAEHLTKEIVQ